MKKRTWVWKQEKKERKVRERCMVGSWIYVQVGAKPLRESRGWDFTPNSRKGMGSFANRLGVKISTVAYHCSGNTSSRPEELTALTMPITYFYFVCDPSPSAKNSQSSFSFYWEKSSVSIQRNGKFFVNYYVKNIRIKHYSYLSTILS